MFNKNIWLDEQTNIVFTPDANGVFYPRYMDFDIKTGNAKIISKIPIYRELFEFVSYDRRQINKKTGEKYSLPLFPYQWSVLIEVIEALLHPSSQQFLWAMSRQSGKSSVMEVLIPFALTILPKYVEVDTNRFTVILGSYKDDAVKELYKKIKPHIYTAIEFYNKRNKDQLLCYYNDKKLKLIDNSDLLEIDKLFSNGEQIPYSQIRNITCGATSDGYSANLLITDESGLISSDLFQTSMSNFTSATAGISVYAGVPNQDSSSLFYSKKRSKTVKTLLYDYPIVRDCKYMVSKKQGDNYVKDYKSKVGEHSGGERSSFIRWNYYLDTEDSNGKFISKATLEENNILTNEIRPPKSNNTTYAVGGIDVSAVGDYKVMVIGESTIYEDFDANTKRNIKKYKNSVCDIIAFNKDGKKQSGEEFAKLCAEQCMKNRLDCVAIDASSAGGKIFTQLFRKYLKLYGINLMVLPFSYNQNKQYLFSTLEFSIYDGDLTLLKENESWESEKLVEEMCYMLKKRVPNTTYVKYEAPQGKGFTDDHINALALFNICLKEIRERSLDKKRCKAEDGSGDFWRIRLIKYSNNDIEIKLKNNDYHIDTIWDIPY